MTIERVIEILRTAPRTGAATDVPEGSRYILISETLVREMMTALERR